MTYAEAVKVASVFFFGGSDNCYTISDKQQALAVLRRAEGVMGAVEGADGLDDDLRHLDGQIYLRTERILRAALRYKEQSQ